MSDIGVDYLVVRPEFRPLFTKARLAEARTRIKRSEEA